MGSVAFIGAACGGGDSEPVDDLQQFDERTLTPVAEDTNTATASATNTATVENTPTATPTPFNGNVARMKIPSIGVDYVVETVGLEENGNQLGTPKNALGAIGWYSIPEYPNLQKPGFGGDAMFSAHVNYNGVDGPFAKLANVKGGDKVIVNMEGGPEYTYQVFAVQGFVIDPNYVTASRPMIDMGKLIDTPDKPAGEEWVTLITCSCAPGRVIIKPGQQFGDCLDRDVVLARRIS